MPLLEKHWFWLHNNRLITHKNASKTFGSICIFVELDLLDMDQFVKN